MPLVSESLDIPCKISLDKYTVFLYIEGMTIVPSSMKRGSAELAILTVLLEEPLPVELVQAGAAG